MEVREPVTEPGPEVKERRCWAVGHPPEPVGRSGRDALEEREHGAHLGNGVERVHELHLGGARVSDYEIDPVRHERLEQPGRAVHRGELTQKRA